MRQDLQTAHLLYTYYRSMGGNEGLSASNFLPVNPNPLTDEERQLLEEQKHQAELDACMARLIAGRGGD